MEYLALFLLPFIVAGLWWLERRPRPVAPRPVPFEDHERIVHALQQIIIDIRKDRDEAVRRLMEMLDPGVNLRLAPPVPRKPKVERMPEPEGPVI